MEITRETIKNLLEPADFSFVYSEKARQAFGMDPEEFEDAVKEYKENFIEVGMADNPALFHMKATSIIKQLNEFHEELHYIVELQKNAAEMEDMQIKDVMQKSKEIFSVGVNILAPYTALLLAATETENIA